MQGSLEDYMELGGVVETRTYQTSATIVGEGYIGCFDQGILNVNRLYREHSLAITVMPHYSVGVPGVMKICGKDEVLDALKNGDVEKKTAIIIDTRGSGYTTNGHIPMAIHLPYSQMVTLTNALVIRPVSALKKLFEGRKIDYLDPKLKIILSCGSGVYVVFSPHLFFISFGE